MKALIMDGEWAPRDPGSLSDESLRERMAPAREVWRNVHRTIQDVPEPADWPLRSYGSAQSHGDLRLGLPSDGD